MDKNYTIHDVTIMTGKIILFCDAIILTFSVSNYSTHVSTFITQRINDHSVYARNFSNFANGVSFVSCMIGFATVWHSIRILNRLNTLFPDSKESLIEWSKHNKVLNSGAGAETSTKTNTGPECLLCCNNPVEVSFVCGHVSCRKCAAEMISRSGLCMCRTPIESIPRRLYF